MMAPQADRVEPMFSPLFTNEPVPVDGQVSLGDAPGFGVDLNPAIAWSRPYDNFR
jgi:L-rhamnonate dehydratase